MEKNKKSGGGDVRASKPAIGDGVLWISPCKRKAQPEAQLGSREAKAVSLGGSVVARHSQEGTHVA